MMSHTLNWVALILVIIGGINWGLMGLFEYNFLAVLFGASEALLRTIYTIIGIAAGYMIYYAMVVEGRTTDRRRHTHPAR